MPKTSSGGVTQRRHAEASRRGVTQRRHAERSRRRSTYLCYALLCYASMGGVVAGACDAGIRPTATITAADTADQVLDSMSHYVTTAGIMRAHLRAETSTLTAREGTYHWRPGDMEARGNVIVVRTDGATLRTEVLRYSQAKNQVSSDKPF